MPLVTVEPSGVFVSKSDFDCQSIVHADVILGEVLMVPALARIDFPNRRPTQADDIVLLRQSVIDLEQSKPDRVRLVASDLLFHLAVFQATGNCLTERLFDIVHRAMLNMMMVTSQLVDLEHALHFHQPIFEAIQQRNPELAARLMDDHLTDAARICQITWFREGESFFASSC